MESQVCREYLATLLGDEVGALTELEALLEHERMVLGEKDLVAIEEAARLRQARIGALARIEEQRRSLCALHGHSADRAGLDDLMSWCDPQGSLLGRLRECAQRAMRCRDLNDCNGTLVRAQMKQVESRLAVLTGHSNFQVVYGPRGCASAPRPKRVLGAA